jgi:hypothetical protein
VREKTITGAISTGLAESRARISGAAVDKPAFSVAFGIDFTSIALDMSA